MLTIHYARENIDKDRFLYGRVGLALTQLSAPEHALARRVLLIVPEQYTLQAERDAFDYTGMTAFFDFDVLSMSSLYRRVFAELGGADEPFLDRYGKFMLLSRLLYRKRDDFLSFRRLERSEAFISRVSDVIADLKSACISSDELSELTAQMEGDSLLKRKLSDVSAIYTEYENTLSGKFLDISDRFRVLTERVGNSAFLAESEIWLSGFDYFSPAAAGVVTELARRAVSVNLVLTAEPGNPFFFLTNSVLERLATDARNIGCEVAVSAIPAEYAYHKPAQIEMIERELFAYGKRPAPAPQDAISQDPASNVAPAQDPTPQNADSAAHDPASQAATSQNVESAPQNAIPVRAALRLVVAANYYAEAETAAAQIAQLVRDEGLRYRDVLVLCNDMNTRASVIRRVFAEYGLPVFLDTRRDAAHNPILRFMLALPEIAAHGRKYEDVFALLKTGLTEIPRDEWEELENYVIKYKTSGKRWDSPFTRGKSGPSAYDTEELERLNDARARVAELLGRFEQDFKAGRTARAKTDALLRFLTEGAHIPAAAENLADALDAEGRTENAREIAGFWEIAEHILLQMKEVLGDMPMSLTEYAIVLRAGLLAIRIGILPPAMDQIVVGTMQRTRAGNAKAIFVLGANDGVLPAESADDGILNDDEKVLLSGLGFEIGRNDDYMRAEEQLAIYRNLCKPQEFLYLSYAVSDADGRELRPSLIFERLRTLFPEIPVEKDILSGTENVLALVQSKEESMHHLAENIRNWANDTFVPAVWKDVWRWLRQNDPVAAHTLRTGLEFRNRRDRIDQKYLDALFTGAARAQHIPAPAGDATCEFPGESTTAQLTDAPLLTSPSALETFSRCPFSWFLGNALKLDERRVFEIDFRNVGDLTHAVLMRYGMELSSDKLPVSDPASRWQQIMETDCKEKTEHIFDEIAPYFEDGLLADGGYERYKAARIRRTACDAAWALTQQAKSGKIGTIFFEAGFGQHGGVSDLRRAGDFPPIEVERDGKKIRVRGRIDRVDILEGDYARIIDYKTGRENFSAPDVLGGWQLQLMIYLKAVSAYKPAGVFYFKINEPHVRGRDAAARAEDIARSFRLDGICVNDPSVLFALGESGKQQAMEATEFKALQRSADELIEKLLLRVMDGDIAVQPMTARRLKSPDNKRKTACSYCNYRGVCGYDKAFE